MAKNRNVHEMEEFLRKVDEIECIIKGLASNDESAAQKADAVIHRQANVTADDSTCINRTVINEDAFKNWSDNVTVSDTGCLLVDDNVDAQHFMAVMESDCHERAERRQKSEAEAEQLKAKGNKEFMQSNYTEAIKFYTEALGHVRYWTTLYTNRAQAYMRQCNFQAALKDCQWAIKVDEKCLKAHVLQGKCFLGLKEYAKAIGSFDEAKKIDPKKELLIRALIDDVKLAKEVETQEELARRLTDGGEYKDLITVMEKFNKADQLAPYYASGLCTMCGMLNSVLKKTVFRIFGGFQLIHTHPLLLMCFSVQPETISLAEAEICALYLDVLLEACMNDQQNQHEVLSLTNFPCQLLKFMESNSKQGCMVTESGVKLLLYLSQTAHNRSEIMIKYDMVRLISVAFSKAQSLPDSCVALNSQRLINSLTVEQKFQTKVYSGFETNVLPSFEFLLATTNYANNSIALCVKTMINLCGDALLRHKLSQRCSLWKACSELLIRLSSCCLQVADPSSTDVIISVLNLMANMAIDVSTDHEHVSVATEVCRTCCDYLLQINNSDIQEGCLILLSRLLKIGAICRSCVDCHHALVVHTMQLMQQSQSKSITKNGIACLTACTFYNKDSRQQIVDSPKGLKTVLGLLSDADDTVIGNAALCMSHCAELKRVCKALTKTNVIMNLLVLARDQAKPAVQHNCAILVAKLAYGHPKHLEKLRELHGLEILNAVLKHGDF